MNTKGATDCRTGLEETYDIRKAQRGHTGRPTHTCNIPDLDFRLRSTLVNLDGRQEEDLVEYIEFDGTCLAVTRDSKDSLMVSEPSI